MIKRWLLKLIGLDEPTFDALIELFNLLVGLLGTKAEARNYVTTIATNIKNQPTDSEAIRYVKRLKDLL